MQNCHGSCDEHLIIKIGSGILEYDYTSWEEQEPPRLFLNPRYQISSIKNGRVADFFRQEEILILLGHLMILKVMIELLSYYLKAGP